MKMHIANESKWELRNSGSDETLDHFLLDCPLLFFLKENTQESLYILHGALVKIIIDMSFF